MVDDEEAEGFKETPSFTIAPSPRHTSGAEGLTPVPARLSTCTKESDDVISRQSGGQKEEAERGGRRRDEGGGEYLAEECSELPSYVIEDDELGTKRFLAKADMSSTI